MATVLTTSAALESRNTVHRQAILTVLTAAIALCSAHETLAADVVRYFESSANGKPRSDAGLAVSSDRLRVDASLAMRAPDGDTRIVPKVSSAVAINRRIGLETRVDLPEWNDHGRSHYAKFDTRLHVKTPAPFVDELEGRMWRSPDGQSGRTLEVGFYQRLREDHLGAPLTIRSKATLETSTGGTLEERRSLGVETEIRGLMSGAGGGKGALRVKLSKSVGPSSQSSRSVAYDRSWAMSGLTNIAVNVGMRHSTSDSAVTVEPSFGLRWNGEF